MRKKIMILMVVLSLGLFGCAGQSGNTVNSDNETTITDPVNNITTEMTPTPESTSTPTLTPTPTPFEIVPKEVDIDINNVVFREPWRDSFPINDHAYYCNLFDEEHYDYPGIDDDVLCAFVLFRANKPKGTSKKNPLFSKKDELFNYLVNEAEIFENAGLECCYEHVIQHHDDGIMRWLIFVIATKQQIREVFDGEHITTPYNGYYWDVRSATRDEYDGLFWTDSFTYIKHAKLKGEDE